MSWITFNKINSLAKIDPLYRSQFIKIDPLSVASKNCFSVSELEEIDNGPPGTEQKWALFYGDFGFCPR